MIATSGGSSWRSRISSCWWRLSSQINRRWWSISSCGRCSRITSSRRSSCGRVVCSSGRYLSSQINRCWRRISSSRGSGGITSSGRACWRNSHVGGICSASRVRGTTSEQRDRVRCSSRGHWRGGTDSCSTHSCGSRCLWSRCASDLVQSVQSNLKSVKDKDLRAANQPAPSRQKE